MPTAVKNKPAARNAVSLNIELYQRFIRNRDEHRLGTPAFLCALLDHFESLNPTRQAELIRGDLAFPKK